MLKDFKTVPAPYATEPISVAELKQYLQLEGAANDANLQHTIRAVRSLVEQRTNISLIDQTATAVMHLTAGHEYYLPWRPVGAVISVAYEGELLVEDADFEVLYSDRKAIKSEYTGLHTIVYELAASDQPDIVDAVRLQAGHVWTHRDDASKPGWDRVAEMIIQANTLMY